MHGSAQRGVQKLNNEQEDFRDWWAWTGCDAHIPSWSFWLCSGVAVSIAQGPVMPIALVLWLNCGLPLLCFAKRSLPLCCVFSTLHVTLINQSSGVTSDIFRYLNLVLNVTLATYGISESSRSEYWTLAMDSTKIQASVNQHKLTPTNYSSITTSSGFAVILTISTQFVYY